MALREDDAPVLVQMVEPPTDYRDIDAELDDIIDGRSAEANLAALVEKHQLRIFPSQRKVLLYLMMGTPRMRRYAYTWLDLAGREGDAGPLIELQRAQTLAIPEQNRSASYMVSPNGGR